MIPLSQIDLGNSHASRQAFFCGKGIASRAEYVCIIKWSVVL